jgi:fatty-acyl-CoA synthase
VTAVIEHCNRRLSNYKVPRYVVIEPSPLPRLPSGKLSKQALREMYKDAASYLAKVR